jgi:hypothetical protein
MGFTPVVQKNKYPIIEMRNKMPVFHPKFFKKNKDTLFLSEL